MARIVRYCECGNAELEKHRKKCDECNELARRAAMTSPAHVAAVARYKATQHRKAKLLDAVLDELDRRGITLDIDLPRKANK